MVACKRMSSQLNTFVINGEEIEYVKKYKYLGIFVSYNGSFQYAQEYLAERAVKAWFSIRNGLYSQKVWPIDIYIYIYILSHLKQ
jgi:hypothetical protein